MPYQPLLALIAAVARNNVIGIDNQLPWRIPDDLRHFRTLTTDHRVIMGRKTHQSLGRPLPNRENVVITRDRDYPAPGCLLAYSLQDALSNLTLPEPIFCIGGAQLYRWCLPLADRLYLTEIDQDFAGDTFFPIIDRQAWRIESTETKTTADFTYRFVCYRRIE